jgi:GTPase
LIDLFRKRLLEGRGETLYEIGYDGTTQLAEYLTTEQGATMDLAETQLDTAYETLVNVAASLAADCHLIHKKLHVAGGWMGIVMMRKRADAVEALEIRVACTCLFWLHFANQGVGNVDAGKSTLLGSFLPGIGINIGVLTKGGLDDGRGKARVNLFRHQHEKESGRTSSVGMEILGYTSTSEPVLNSQVQGRKLTWEEISEKSSKVISFIDLAGHEKYLRTTVFGLTGCAPDYVMLMVGGNAGLIGMSKEHLGISVSLGVPVMVVITKVDMVRSHIKKVNVDTKECFGRYRETVTQDFKGRRLSQNPNVHR